MLELRAARYGHFGLLQLHLDDTVLTKHATSTTTFINSVSEQTVIITLKSIIQMIFVMDTCCVFSR